MAEPAKNVNEMQRIACQKAFLDGRDFARNIQKTDPELFMWRVLRTIDKCATYSAIGEKAVRDLGASLRKELDIQHPGAIAAVMQPQSNVWPEQQAIHRVALLNRSDIEIVFGRSATLWQRAKRFISCWWNQ